MPPFFTGTQEFSWSDVESADDDSATGAAAEAPSVEPSSKKRGADQVHERSSKKAKAGLYIPRGFEFVPVRDWNLLLWNIDLYIRTS